MAERGASKKRKTGLKNVKKAEDDGTQVEQRTHRQGPAKGRGNGAFSKEARGALKVCIEEFVAVNPKATAGTFVNTRISAQKNPTTTKTAFMANMDKNRYNDVICGDAFRVKLHFPPDNPCDYVHANFVEIDGQQRYICAQGPTAKTCVDFWRMIWQEKCAGVLMLAEVKEQGRPKCEQYWPTGEEPATYGPFTIKKLNMIPSETCLKVTTLELCYGDDTRKVEHMAWQGWPDRGAPTEYGCCLRLIQKMQRANSIYVVHCSAGIGRTGTIVGLDMIMKKFEKGEKATMPEIVAELRKYRLGSVQTEVQFLYMLRVLILYAQNMKVVAKDDPAVNKWVSEYEDFMKAQDAKAKQKDANTQKQARKKKEEDDTIKKDLKPDEPQENFDKFEKKED